MKHTKDPEGHHLHLSNSEVKTAARVAGYMGAGLVVIRLLRFLVAK
ncbi:MAG: hypothetical protein JRI36_08275 [Deltaproteobacteria bacterium]|nr:hypothetical protein [Deltaproteobacteria bacterium]